MADTTRNPRATRHEAGVFPEGFPLPETPVTDEGPRGPEAERLIPEPPDEPPTPDTEPCSKWDRFTTVGKVALAIAAVGALIAGIVTANWLSHIANRDTQTAVNNGTAATQKAINDGATKTEAAMRGVGTSLDGVKTAVDEGNKKIVAAIEGLKKPEEPPKPPAGFRSPGDPPVKVEPPKDMYSVNQLITMMSDPDGAIALAAAQRLIERKDESVKPLVASIADPKVGKGARYCLRKIGDDAVVDLIDEGFASANPAVRTAASDVVVQIASRKAREELTKAEASLDPIKKVTAKRTSKRLLEGGKEETLEDPSHAGKK